MQFPSEIKKSTVLLSGPASGLGRNIFKLLVENEYPIVCLGRRLRRLPAIFEGESPSIKLIDFDFGGELGSLAVALKELEHAIEGENPGPTIFISNAAIIEPVGESSENILKTLEKTIRINTLTPLMIANTIARATNRRNCSLFIVNIDSGASTKPIRGWQAYCATKAAYRMGLDVLALENPLVEVLHYEPGAMDTPMQELIRTKKISQMPDVENFKKLKSQGFLKMPDDVAEEILQIVKNYLQ